MSLFQTKDRALLMKQMEASSKQNEHIIALVMVGSGAFGYRDELSDLDMVVAIDKEENLTEVMEYVGSMLRKYTSIIYEKTNIQRHLQVYLTREFLEIDIGFGPYQYAAAFKKDWKVLFDKSGTVDYAMRISWERISENSGTDEKKQKVQEIADSVWHNFMHAAMSMKREQIFRAIAELDLIRENYRKLLGLHYNLDVVRGRELDSLPEEKLQIIRNQILTNLSKEALWDNLHYLTDTVYEELAYYGEEAGVKITKEQIIEYADECRKLSGKEEL